MAQNADVELDEVADKLEAWARRRKVTEDVYVNKLLTAIDDRHELSYWANINAVEMLPKPTSGHSRKLLSLARKISLFRNVLIFTPVALTWYSIGQATRAFQTYIEMGAKTTANFLEFWQNGYDVLAPEWRIGNVAVLDFFIILTLIFLSLITGSLQIRALRVDYEDSEAFESERLSLGFEIHHALHKYKGIAPADISRVTSEAIRSLSSVSKNLSKANSDLQRSLQHTDRFRKAGTALEAASRKSAQSSAEISREVKVLKKISDQQKRESKQISQRVKKALKISSSKKSR